MDFNAKIDEARKAGYNDAEIVDYLKSKDNRVSEAINNGYKPQEIISYLSQGTTTKVTTKPPSGGEDILNRMYDMNVNGDLTTSTQDSINPQQDQLNEPTVNPDGTISTVSTGQPETYQGAFTQDVAKPLEEGARQTVAGARTFTAGGAKLVNDMLAKAGLPNEKEVTDEAVTKLGDYIDRYNSKHPDQIIHPSTVGQLASYSLAPVSEGIAANSAIFGGLSFLDSLGKTGDYSEAVVDGTIGAVLGGASTAVLNKIFPGGGKLTKEAELLLKLNQGRITEKEAIKQLKGIPKKDQAISLAESIDLAKNYFGAAVRDDSRLATKLGKRLQARHDIMKPFTASTEEVAGAKQSYNAMREELDKKATGVFNPTELQAQLDDKMIGVYATDPSGLGTALKKIKLDVSEPITAGNALDIVENINALLRKPSIKKDYKTSKVLTNIKSSLKDFMSKTVDPETMRGVKQSISHYRETMNREAFGEIVKKHTKADFATDWEGVLKDVKKEGLNGQNIDFVIPILKEFEKKFHNDKYLANVITPMGSKKPMSWLGALSYAVGKIYDIASRLIDKSRYKDIQIRKAIIRSIKRGDNTSPLSFLDDLVKDKTLTIEQAEKIKSEMPPEYKQIEWKPNSKTTGDVNAKPLYATEQGTVAETPSTSALVEAQTNLVKEALGKGYSIEKAQKIDNILNSKRFEGVMKSTSDRMKADDIQGNMNILQKTIESEVDTIVQRVNKDIGVKLPKSEVEKLYRMKLKEALKDCK